MRPDGAFAACRLAPGAGDRPPGADLRLIGFSREAGVPTWGPGLGRILGV